MLRTMGPAWSAAISPATVFFQASSATPADPGTPAEPAPVLEIRHVSKAFGSIQALDDVSIDLRPGEIHALLGENGAGKSTLIKVMTGVQQPDSGTILVDGQPVTIANALDAQRLGVAAIYQEPMIFPDLSVAENVFIAHRDQGRIVRRLGGNDGREQHGQGISAMACAASETRMAAGLVAVITAASCRTPASSTMPRRNSLTKST